MSSDNIQLTFKDQLLEDSLTFAQCDIGADSVIFLTETEGEDVKRNPRPGDRQDTQGGPVTKEGCLGRETKSQPKVGTQKAFKRQIPQGGSSGGKKRCMVRADDASDQQLDDSCESESEKHEKEVKTSVNHSHSHGKERGSTSSAPVKTKAIATKKHSEQSVPQAGPVQEAASSSREQAAQQGKETTRRHSDILDISFSYEDVNYPIRTSASTSWAQIKTKFCKVSYCYVQNN